LITKTEIPSADALCGTIGFHVSTSYISWIEMTQNIPYGRYLRDSILADFKLYNSDLFSGLIVDNYAGTFHRATYYTFADGRDYYASISSAVVIHTINTEFDQYGGNPKTITNDSISELMLKSNIPVGSVVRGKMTFYATDAAPAGTSSNPGDCLISFTGNTTATGFTIDTTSVSCESDTFPDYTLYCRLNGTATYYIGSGYLYLKELTVVAQI